MASDPGSESQLITCAMVTRVSRLALAGQSARSFARQSLANRELLILTSDSRPSSAGETSRFEAGIREAAGERVRFIHFDEPLSLGALRNTSFANARGGFLCQWDDDDLSHPERLSAQHAALTAAAPAAGASFLTEVVHLLVEENAAFVCSWKRAPQGGHPGTGLFRAGLASRYAESGEEAARGEDTAFALAVQSEGSIASPDRGPLYAYRFTGGNTWAREHHLGLIEKMAVSRALLQRRERALRAQLLEMDLPAGLELRGSNGLAFIL